MIIDVHTHCAYHKLYPQVFLEKIGESVGLSGEQSDASRNLVMRVIKSNMNDIDAGILLKQMDEAGIDKSILLITDLGYGWGEAELSIEEIYEYYRRIKDQNSGRFIVFGGIDPRRGEDGYRLFKKSIEHFGFKGLKLYPPCGFEINDSSLFDFYGLCDSYGLPVLIHTGAYTPSLSYEQKEYPGSIIEMAGKYKNTKFILGHAGIKDYLTGISLAAQMENIYLDISAFQPEISEKQLLAEKLKKLFETVPEKILFGTDWPMFLLSGTQKKWVEFIMGLNVLKGEDLDRLFYKNIKTIIDI